MAGHSPVKRKISVPYDLPLELVAIVNLLEHGIDIVTTVMQVPLLDVAVKRKISIEIALAILLHLEDHLLPIKVEKIQRFHPTMKKIMDMIILREQTCDFHKSDRVWKRHTYRLIMITRVLQMLLAVIMIKAMNIVTNAILELDQTKKITNLMMKVEWSSPIT